MDFKKVVKKPNNRSKRNYVNLTENDVKKYLDDLYKNGLVHSFNNMHDYSKLNNKVKVIIVGTLTPKAGRDIGYFYMANNDMYTMLGKYFNEDLDKYKTSTSDKKQLQNYLYNKGIAFMDVVGSAIQCPMDSAEDSDIGYFNLDYDNFRKITSSNIKFITTSDAAYEAFCRISEKLNKSWWINPNNIKQCQLFHYYKSFDINMWHDTLQKFGV